MEHAPYNLPPAAFQSPAVTPDGEHMILVIATSNRAALTLRSIRGGNEYRIADVPGVAYFAISPNSHYVALLQTRAPTPTISELLVGVRYPPARAEWFRRGAKNGAA